jgi:TonB-linked SusC/RagA family outer membrane protein
MKKLLLLLIIFFTAQVGLFAQSKTISGIVKDKNGDVVIGATVAVNGTNRGAITDINGEYTIQASPGEKLIISFVGSQSQEIVVGQESKIDILLLEDTNLLEEVVISGYGIETFKKETSGAVSKIDQSTLKNTAPVNVSELLQGRAAGVNIVSNDGTPGAGFSINIRGSNSISGGSSPLIVIDNIPYITDGNSTVNPLSVINPNDIASIDVLKDASATALYGVGATNGVIVITTKNGAKGKPIINLNVKRGFGTFARTLPVLSSEDYALYRATIARTSGGNNGGQAGAILNPGAPSVWEMVAFLNQGDEGGDIKYRDVLKNQYGLTNYEGTNWLDVITQNTQRAQYDFDFSGSSNNGTSYFASLGYLNEKGLLINSGFSRLSGRLNLEQKIGKIITAGMRLQYANTDYEGLIGDWRVDNAVSQSTFMNPFINRDNITGGTEGVINNGGQGAGPESPEFRLNETISNRQTNWFSGNLNISVKPLSWLEFAMNAGLTNDLNSSNYFVSRVLREASNTNGRAILEKGEDIRWTINPRIAINHKFNKNHKIAANLIYEARKTADDRLRTTYEQFSTEVLKDYTLQAAGSVFSVPQYFDIRDQSFIGRVQYDYKRKYVFTSSLRVDQSSRFITDKTGIFPAASFAWNIIDEPFMKFSEKYLSNLKIRGGVGVTGNNQIPINSGLLLGNLSNGGYPFNNSVSTSVNVGTRFANPDVTWEQTTGLNLGIDFGFLKDRFTLSTNVYSNRTSGLLLDVQLPTYSSFTSTIRNVGGLTNRGLELELTSFNINKRNFSWNTNFNIAWNRNKITDLGGQPDLAFTVIGTGPNTNDVLLRVGQPIGVYYGTIQDGLINNETELLNSPRKTADNNVGEFGFLDVNGDGLIDRTEYVPMAYALPLHTGGIGNTLTYKSFDFYAFMRWSYGNDVVNNNLNRAHYLRGDNNLQTIISNDIWNRQDQDRNYQSYFAIFTTRSGSTFSRSEMVEDGSFLRFETLRVGYTLPSKFMKKVNLRTAKITFTGQNLALLSRYSWFDPEVNAARGQNRGLFPGLDQGAYPRSRFFLFGVDLGF